MKSNYFSQPAMKGLIRIGDVYMPENGDLPSFSQFGCAEHVDDLIAYLPKEDLDLLNIVLTILSIMPGSFLRWLVRTMEQSLDRSGMIPSLLRQLNLGLRGIIFSCYYSGNGGTGHKGNDPLDVIGYHLNRVTD